MIPVYLKISGFLSYMEPVDLDFSSFNIACITGANGAGKSSLLDAITWALFGQARRRDDALVNSRSKVAEVVFDFSYERNLFRVQRSKKEGKTTGLEFLVRDPSGESWNTLTEATLRETEAQIQRTLRLDYETFTNASFFLQGKADQFSQQRPGDRKRILGSILGLDVWETYREKASDRRRAVDSAVSTLDQRMEEIHTELQQENVRRERLKDLEENLVQLSATRQAQQGLLDELRRRVDTVERQGQLVETLASQLDSAQGRIAQRLLQLDEREKEKADYQTHLSSSEEIIAAYQTWQMKRDELARWEEVAADFRQHDAQRAKPLLVIEAESSRLGQEKKSLITEQEKLNADEDNLLLLKMNCLTAEAEIAELEKKVTKRAEIEEEMRVFTERRANASAENRRMKADMDLLRERIDRLEDTEGGSCPLCGQQLNPDERQKLVDRLEAEGKQMGDRYRANRELEAEGDKQSLDYERDLAQYKQIDDLLRQKQREADQLNDHQGRIQEHIVVWNTTGALRLTEIERLLSEDDFAFDARRRLDEANEALKGLGYDAGAHDIARAEELAGRTSEEQLRKLEVARGKLEPLEAMISDLKKQLDEQREDVARQESDYQDAKVLYEQNAGDLPDINQVETGFFELQEKENLLLLEIGGVRQQVEVLERQRERAHELGIQREEKLQMISRLKMIERAFSKDGIPALLIEQALPEIEIQANDVLGRLTGGEMSVRFATQKDYKDKKRTDKKETLDILISDSAGIREYEMFSGGEAFRVNFAIRLALSKVLAKRAGARLQTLVIDEGFGSQDREGRQRLVEVINMIRDEFEKILVITHLEDMKEVFQARIEVEKSNRGSQLQVFS
jgi:DNA repair protein SbcC/Rad50